MKAHILVGLITGLVSTSAYATKFTCEGRAEGDSGNWVHAQITLDVDDDSLSVTEEGGTGFKFDMQANYDSSYTPSAKYAGYYRYYANATTAGGWRDVLIQKFMRDNKKAKSGSVVLQGTEEDGGMAAYFDSCERAK